MAGATNDWCYLRQIGQPENFKLAFDNDDEDNEEEVDELLESFAYSAFDFTICFAIYFVFILLFWFSIKIKFKNGTNIQEKNLFTSRIKI